MKTKNITAAAIILIILAACAPAAKLAPTVTVAPAPTVTPVPPSPTLSPPPTATEMPGKVNPQNGHLYLGVYLPMGWNEARDYCRKMKGDLVTITSEQENQFVYHLNPHSWIGLSDATEEGNWKWVTGEPVEYTNWATGEPNDCTDCTNLHIEEGEDYVNFSDNPPDQWNDWPAFEVSSFVCEWDAVHFRQGT